jgi:hypothetical protein
MSVNPLAIYKCKFDNGRTITIGANNRDQAMIIANEANVVIYGSDDRRPAYTITFTGRSVWVLDD